MKRVLKRKTKAPSKAQGRVARRVIVQEGTNENDGYLLERKSQPEVIYFRSKADRDFAARADQLAYDLREESAR